MSGKKWIGKKSEWLFCTDRKRTWRAIEGPWFPGGGGALALQAGRQPITWHFFSGKVHENEKDWKEGDERGVPGTPFEYANEGKEQNFSSQLAMW